jgi:sporulation protein YtfJ
VDANTVIGTPIVVAEGVTIIPVSKISYGFASGGSDLPSKSSSDLFGGGAGAGVNITPVAFLTVKNGEINLLPVVSKPDTFDRLVSLVPDAVGKISDLAKKKDKTEE